MSLVRRYPLTAFVVLACALSWWPWILYSLDLLPTPIVGFGPFLAALAVLAVTEGKRGVLGLLRRMVRWRVGLQWYAAALLLPIVVTLAAAVLNVFLLGAQRTSSVADLGGWSKLLLTFLLWLLIPGLAGTWEEPGFRGYALPRLQARHSALAASLILGVLWAFWHLPLMVVGQINWSDIVLVIAAAIVSTWLFNNASGSVLILMVFHAMNNTISGSFFSPMFSGADSVRQGWLLAGLWCVVAVIVVVAAGPARLSRKHEKQQLSAQAVVAGPTPRVV
jgi:membrane protease YdiL (CAAX protease family)